MRTVWQRRCQEKGLTMERSYKAFISYRHKPLDIDTAKKLHRRIESYVIPEPLRLDGQKKLGIVFRDLDELPISSNLSANVQEALDHSEYLIVICTPETPKSLWVLREIDYFLEHHDRDHVLAVLADGTPETSFPFPLTEIRAPDGELLEEIEPLAANIVADSPVKRRKLFRTESLRILAALIGCPYDALYRREERYRRRRAGFLTGVAAVIAAAFIGMLLNRNAQIRNQLRQTQISESRAFAALAETAYAEGDYRGALQYAVRALPDGENDRPYVPEAELALSSILQPYAQGKLRYVQSFEQESTIFALDLSMDGSRTATVDREGVLRFFNTDTAKQVWEQKVDIDVYDPHFLNPQLVDSQRKPVCILEGQGGVLVRGNTSIELVSAVNGEQLWKRTDLIGLNLAAISPYHSYAIATEWEDISPFTVHVMDLETGDIVRSASFPTKAGSFCPAAAFFRDESSAAFLLTDSEGNSVSLYLWNIASATPELIAGDLPYSYGSVHYGLLFCEDGDLILARDGSLYDNSAILRFDRDNGWSQQYSIPVETEINAEVVDGVTYNYASIALLDCRGDYLAFGSKHFLHMISAESGELLWSQRLTGVIASAAMYDSGGLGLVLSNGIISYCSVNGNLMVQQEVNSFVCGSDLAGGAAEGLSFSETTFVTVPISAPKRMAVIRTRRTENLTQLTERQSDTYRTVFLTSPSGKQILCIDYDPVGNPLRGRRLNQITGEEQNVKLSAEEGNLINLDRLCLNDDGMLCFTDLLNPRAIPESDKLPENTVRVIPACEDRFLAAFTRNGEIIIYDRQSGEMLHRADYSEQNVMFTEHYAHYDIRESQNQNRLLIICDDLGSMESKCIVIDKDTWKTVGVFSGVAAYLPESDSVLIRPFVNGTFRCPLFTRQDLLSQAKQITEAQDP